MSEQVQPIRKSTHNKLAWRTPENYAFSKGLQIVPVAALEVSAMAVEFPIAFVVDPKPAIVGVLGLPGQGNLFVGNDGRWLGTHLPALLKTYPFKLLPADKNQFVLGVDHSSGLIIDGDQTGQSFFDHLGEPTAALRSTLQGLIMLQRSLEQMDNVASILSTMGLLEPWPIKLRGNDSETDLRGLFRVSEASLTALSDDEFLKLREGATLPVAYAHLVSMQNISRMSRLAQFHSLQQAHQAKEMEASASLFAGSDGEEQIDWDAILKDD